MSKASVILVEDEALIRLLLIDMIEELGHRVIAVAGDVSDGRALAQEEEYDLAILDINLHGFDVQPVAEAVVARGLPLLFVTGYGPAGVPATLRERPVLRSHV
ncbi:response regulator [Bradyrhizobium neotropicale]|uniref:response regulator n=1 Tax=Bradyrhizobium neotropicale TaxID=1497615 RepID=UPI0009EF3713|nr:response regulator [Bradyrhizobium neotropicale]